MSYPQGPQQMPPSGNGNRGNGNPFKRNSSNDSNGNQKGNNSGGPQPFWKSPWLWGVLLVVMAVAGFQLFAGAGTQTIDTKDASPCSRPRTSRTPRSSTTSSWCSLS